MADPSLEQVLASPELTKQHASLADGERVDEAAYAASLTGYFHVRGLGLGFFTCGEQPRLEAGRKPGAVEASLRRAGSEAVEHSVFHLFGIVLGGLFLGKGRSPYKRAERLGKQMLRHPASFGLPWPALVGAEYAPPLIVSRTDGPALVDPLVLTEERERGTQKRVLFVERDGGADAPAPVAEDLLRRRARFEALAATLALLAPSVETNGRGPFSSLQLNDLAKGWFGKEGGVTLDAFAAGLGTSVSTAELTARATGWLARYPIAAALDTKASLDGSSPKLPPEGWPFPDWLLPAEAVDMYELL